MYVFEMKPNTRYLLKSYAGGEIQLDSKTGKYWLKRPDGAIIEIKPDQCGIVYKIKLND